MAASTILFPQTAGSTSDTGLPSTSQLLGEWHITHTTFPLWRDKQNIVVVFSSIANSPQIDDLVSYDVLGADSGAVKKQKSVHGYDTPSTTQAGVYTWQGAGWMRVAKSQWEIVGYAEAEKDDQGATWMATYAQKSLFTPAGLNIYARGKEEVPSSTIEDIKKALTEAENQEIRDLVKSFYEVSRG
jgi:hypothetical protein